jgi:hypothetical protein
MTNLQELFHTVEELSPEDFDALRQFIEARRGTGARQEKPSEAQVDQWMTELKAAIAEFREGLSEGELAELIWAMNYEIGDPIPPQYQHKRVTSTI